MPHNMHAAQRELARLTRAGVADRAGTARIRELEETIAAARAVLKKAR